MPHEGLVLSGELLVIDIRVGLGCTFRDLRNSPDQQELTELFRIGEARVVRRAQNKVVDLGRSLIRALIGNGASLPAVTNGTQSYGTVTIADLAISAMKFGNLNSPTAPAAADFQLQDVTILHTAVPTVTYPSNYSVRWTGLIPANTYVGQQVTEEGLFAISGALFARTTFAPSAITVGFAKSFAHTISIVAT